eukprot:919118-Pelagomonas_calceolata.AAC.2
MAYDMSLRLPTPVTYTVQADSPTPSSTWRPPGIPFIDDGVPLQGDAGVICAVLPSHRVFCKIRASKTFPAQIRLVIYLEMEVYLCFK